MSGLGEESCRGSTTALPDEDVRELLYETPGWSLDGGTLARDVQTRNFAGALDLLNHIAALAEEENHHPDLCLHGWNHLRIVLSTHSVGGLSRNDFIVAAKINGLLERIGRQPG